MKIELSEKSLDMIYWAIEKAQPKPVEHGDEIYLTSGDMSVYMECRDLIAEIKDQDPRWQRVQ